MRLMDRLHAWLGWLSQVGPKAEDHVLQAAPVPWTGFPEPPPERNGVTRRLVQARIKELLTRSFDELAPIDAGTLPAYVIPIEDGVLSVVGIYHEPDSAVVKCFAPAGSFFSTHTHAEAETIVTISGQIEYYQGNDDCRVLEAGESIHVPPNVPHAVRYPVDTWSFGITVPASKAFPSAAGVSEGADAPAT